ncbi:MAG: hypothetical protein VYD98_01990 [Bacteroidota bacterium]|nr:hypothetical protein [Bacteroidota bacterium]
MQGLMMKVIPVSDSPLFNDLLHLRLRRILSGPVIPRYTLKKVNAALYLLSLTEYDVIAWISEESELNWLVRIYKDNNFIQQFSHAGSNLNIRVKNTKKERQPVFAIKAEILFSLFDNISQQYQDGAAFGELSASQWRGKFNEMAGDGNEIHVSKVANLIDRHQTGKLTVNANKAIYSLLRQVREKRHIIGA